MLEQTNNRRISELKWSKNKAHLSWEISQFSRSRFMYKERKIKSTEFSSNI